MASDCIVCQQPMTTSPGINPHFATKTKYLEKSNLCLDRTEVGNVFIKSLVHVLQAYGMHAQDKLDFSDTVFVSGGLQQYLIRTGKKQDLSVSQPRKGFESNVTTFHDLPDSLQLHIFSYLRANDLCRIAPVCSHWLLLSNDNILWKRRMLQDIDTWPVICHSGNPDIYNECQSDLSDKEIYLQCSPEVRMCIRQQNMGVHNFSSFVRSFMPKKIPKLVMFGPGLESETSGITRKILEGESQLFKTTGMFPGQFEGIGSGFTMKMHNVAFNLVTLYTSTKSERHNVAHNQRLQVNRMLVGNNQEDDSAASNDRQTYEVRPAIKELCQSVDGFIFVVDSSIKEKEALEGAKPELYSIINDHWTQAAAPVLVLSCTPTRDTRSHPCVSVVRHLKLSKFSRPWQAHDCEVDTLNGIEAGIEWIVGRIHRI